MQFSRLCLYSVVVVFAAMAGTHGWAQGSAAMRKALTESARLKYVGIRTVEMDGARGPDSPRPGTLGDLRGPGRLGGPGGPGGPRDGGPLRQMPPPRREGEARKVRERVFQDGVLQRIEVLEGDRVRFVVIDTPNGRIGFQPGSDFGEQLPPRRDRAVQWLRELNQALASGRFKASEEAGPNVAGLPTRVVTLRNAEGKLVSRLWIHPQSGMILKRDVYGPGERQIGGFEFSEIRFVASQDPKLFQIPQQIRRQNDAVERVIKMFRESETPPFVFRRESPFRLASSRVLEDGKTRAIVQTYVSPEGTVTLVVSKQQIDANRLKRLSQGRFNTYAWNEGGVSLVLIGEVDQNRLRRISVDVARL